MAYKRKYATVEERRAAQAEGGRMGYAAALANGKRLGRRPVDDGQLEYPYGCTTISIRNVDAAWLSDVSKCVGISRPLLIRVLIQTFRERCDVRARDEVERIMGQEFDAMRFDNLFAEDKEEEEGD